MLRGALFSCFVLSVAGHGAMLHPKPRSSHNQTWDEHNKCGATDPYSHTGLNPGEYCGLGCLGDSCLYYQIGCFQGCKSCSLMGKTLYPVAHDLTLAGCDESTMPEPTLGGGNKTLEHLLRSYNIDNDSEMGDWTKWMPWRSPGSAGRGNPNFQPCGVNSGALASQPEPPTTAKDVPNGGPGTSLPALPRDQWSVWKVGSVVEAEWAIYANHAGGYSYRLCKKVPGQAPTEACYQKTPLKFATPETEIRYKDGSQPAFKITSMTTDVGTYPPGSQWRKNPVPMCNCDIGLHCGGKASKEEKKAALKQFDVKKAMKAVKAKELAFEEAMLKRRLKGKTCQPDPTCGPASYGDKCKVCDTDPEWSCKECCPGCTAKPLDGGIWCVCSGGKGPSPAPAPKNPMFEPYKHTHFRPGQTNKICPTGVQFPTYFDGGAGAGSNRNFGAFDFTMVDELQVPSDITPGEYSLSWRWDCEETPQVWNSCADIIIEKA